MNREGWRFVAIFAVITVILFWVWAPLGWLGLLGTAWCVYFFRDPDRVTPVRDGLVVAPADGIVVQVTDAVPPAELDMGDTPMPRISIFLNVFDVHVNRMPCDGRIVRTHYRPGKFVNAALDKASVDNERMALRVRPDAADVDPGVGDPGVGDPGIPVPGDMAVVQIAGLVARRIVLWSREGDQLLAGQRFGMIRFGSRTDLYLPPGIAPLVMPGQRTIGGETVVADLASREPQRVGVAR
ncbi:MAG: phosphatidylserine decarboxylase [Alphaproteobacteria bacterium]